MIKALAQHWLDGDLNDACKQIELGDVVKGLSKEDVTALRNMSVEDEKSFYSGVSGTAFALLIAQQEMTNIVVMQLADTVHMLDEQLAELQMHLIYKEREYFDA